MPSSLLFLTKLKLNNSNLLKFSDLTTITNSASLPLFFAEKAKNQHLYLYLYTERAFDVFWRKVKQSMFEYCSYIKCNVN